MTYLLLYLNQYYIGHIHEKSQFAKNHIEVSKIKRQNQENKIELRRRTLSRYYEL